MKHVLRSIGTILVMFTLAYLMGCFTHASFDITQWTSGARGLVGGMGGIMSILIGVAVFAASVELDESED